MPKRPTRQGSQTAAYHNAIKRIRQELNCDLSTARNVYSQRKFQKHFAGLTVIESPAAATPPTSTPNTNTTVYTPEQLALSPVDMMQIAKLHLDQLSQQAAELDKQQQEVQHKINQWSTVLALRDQPALQPTAYQEAIAEFAAGS